MIQKTSPVRRWKQWLALPLLGALLFTVACERNKPVVQPAGTSVSTVDLQGDAGAPPPPKLVSEAENMPAPPPPPAVFTYVEQMPELPGGGGNKAIVAYIQNHLVYPSVAAARQLSGRVFVSFIVAEQGDVQAVHIMKGLSPAYDAAVVAAVKQLPRFTPGRQRFPAETGEPKAVAVSFTVPIQFETETGATAN